MGSTTVTVRLPDATRERLEALARQTHRSTSVLAGEAIADYVERELATVEGIEQALADDDAGRVVPHEDVMSEIDALIDAAERRQQGG
ncbi:MAG: ribbon-helix-helix protein, CopG family [Rhodospirillaceae bacterium]|nr:ribbon-helix-helix protein, CopG family [Rhodospirillaceae bacterium]